MVLNESNTLSLSLAPPTLRASNLRIRVATPGLDLSSEDEQLEDGLVSPKRHEIIQRKLLAYEGENFNFFSCAAAA